MRDLCWFAVTAAFFIIPIVKHSCAQNYTLSPDKAVEGPLVYGTTRAAYIAHSLQHYATLRLCLPLMELTSGQ